MVFKCKECREDKNSTEFYQRTDCKSLSVYQPCIFCRKSLWNKYGLSKCQDRSRPPRKKWTTEAAKARYKRYKERNKERLKPAWVAHKAVQRAIMKGTLVRPDNCEQCKSKCKPDAAHSDYTKVLNIRWLCRKCHSKWDDVLPKTL